MSEQRRTTTTTDLPRTAIAPLLRRARRTTTAVTVDPRNAEVRDWRLAATLVAEDHAEHEGLNPLERLTCRTHRRWVHECVHLQAHVFVVTGHRWCRRCECAADVAVDQLTWEVAVRCPSCGQPPECAATRQIVRTCRASLAASQTEA